MRIALRARCVKRCHNSMLRSAPCLKECVVAVKAPRRDAYRGSRRSGRQAHGQATAGALLSESSVTVCAARKSTIGQSQVRPGDLTGDWFALVFVADVRHPPAPYSPRFRCSDLRFSPFYYLSGVLRSANHSCTIYYIPPGAVSYSSIGVPSDLVSSRNRSNRRFVMAPGFPPPMTRPSTSITGTSSAAVPVRKHSSAV